MMMEMIGAQFRHFSEDLKLNKKLSKKRRTQVGPLLLRDLKNRLLPARQQVVDAGQDLLCDISRSARSLERRIHDQVVMTLIGEIVDPLGPTISKPIGIISLDELLPGLESRPLVLLVLPAGHPLNPNSGLADDQHLNGIRYVVPRQPADVDEVVFLLPELSGPFVCAAIGFFKAVALDVLFDGDSMFGSTRPHFASSRTDPVIQHLSQDLRRGILAASRRTTNGDLHSPPTFPKMSMQTLFYSGGNVNHLKYKQCIIY